MLEKILSFLAPFVEGHIEKYFFHESQGGWLRWRIGSAYVQRISVDILEAMMNYVISKHLFLIIPRNSKNVNRYFTVVFGGLCREVGYNLQTWLCYEFLWNCLLRQKRKIRRTAQVIIANYVHFADTQQWNLLFLQHKY